MLRSAKLYLLLSSVLCFGLISCQLHKYKASKKCNEVIIDQNSFKSILQPVTATKYKTDIDVLKNHLTGIMVVKQTDSVTMHLVFLTELGMKLFDFEVKPAGINAVYVFEPLNKPALINSLKRNFNDIFLFNVFNKEVKQCSSKRIILFYSIPGKRNRVIIPDSVGIKKQETFNGHRKASKIDYMFDPKTKTYTQIKAVQYGIVKIRIELNLIKN